MVIPQGLVQDFSQQLVVGEDDVAKPSKTAEISIKNGGL